MYKFTATYREWLQRWTTDLITQLLALPATDRNVMACKTIFGVFRGILKSQDVAVAHHILPYLVLTLLLLGGEDRQKEICAEINTVLLDQVSPSSPATADKRMLSSQVIFDLMDHLSNGCDRRELPNPVRRRTGPITSRLSTPSYRRSSRS